MRPPAGSKQRVNPNAVVRTVLNREDRSLHVLTRLRVKKLRVPVRPGPAAFSFRTEESRGADQRRPDDELKAIADMCRLCHRSQSENRIAAFIYAPSIDGYRRRAASGRRYS